MSILTTFFAALGACYVSWLITKFILWLDGAGPAEPSQKRT